MTSVETVRRINQVGEATVPRPNRCVAGATSVEVTDGSTTRNIEAGLHIGTEQPRTDLGERHAVIPSPTAKPAPYSRSAVRAAICRAPAPEDRAWATGAAVLALAWAPGPEEGTA